MRFHRTELIYRRYAIADFKVLEEAAVKLAMLRASEAGSADTPVVVAINNE